MCISSVEVQTSLQNPIVTATPSPGPDFQHTVPNYMGCSSLCVSLQATDDRRITSYTRALHTARRMGTG
jgi:hypothetical protein